MKLIKLTLKSILLFGLTFTSSYAVDIVIGDRNTTTINCVPPTQYTNDEPIPSTDVGELRLYSGVNQLGAGLDCPFTIDISNLTVGSYPIVLRAYSDVYRVESEDSNTDVINILARLQKKSPTNLRAE